MVNPIHFPAGHYIQTGISGTADARRPVAPSPTGAAVESVQLSPEAAQAPAALRLGPPRDEARIADLRDRIAAGSYRPDPQRIADAIAGNLFEISD